jgi:hypothetical protein
MDRWQSKPIACQGGLVLNLDGLTQGTTLPGTARILQNFEPSLSGGYRRLTGYSKFDSTTVNSGNTNPIQAVMPYSNGVLAVRKTTAGTDNAVYFSSGSGWTRVNTTLRAGSPSKARFLTYSIIKPVAILTDGVNYAWKWDGTSETTINGSGAPTNPKYAAIFRNRLALTGYGDGSKLSISAPNDDNDFTGVSGAAEINVGDTVTGLGLFREQLIIFCRNSIKKLTGTTSSDFAIVNVSQQIGCISHDTIQEIGGDLIYLALDGFRSYAATERNDDVELGLVSQSIQPAVQVIINKQFNSDSFSSCPIRIKNQYRVFVYDSSLTDTDSVGLLARFQDNPVTPSGQFEWGTLKGIPAYCAGSQNSTTQEIAVFGHATNGYVYRLESGNTFDSSNILAIYRTPDLTFDDATIRKVFFKLDVFTQTEGDFDASVNLLLDRERTSVIQPAQLNLSQTGEVPVYGTAVYGTDTYGQFVFPQFKRNLVGSGFFGAFQFISNDDSAPFRIDSFIIQFAPKGRR